MQNDVDEADAALDAAKFAPPRMGPPGLNTMARHINSAFPNAVPTCASDLRLMGPGAAANLDFSSIDATGTDKAGRFGRTSVSSQGGSDDIEGLKQTLSIGDAVPRPGTTGPPAAAVGAKGGCWLWLRRSLGCGPKSGSSDSASSDGYNAAAEGQAEKEVAKKAAVVVDVPLSRLLELNRPEWWLGVVGGIASACAGVQQPAFAFVLSGMIVTFYDANAVSGRGLIWPTARSGNSRAFICASHLFCIRDSTVYT